jgi:hypothetical protein
MLGKYCLVEHRSSCENPVYRNVDNANVYLHKKSGTWYVSPRLNVGSTACWMTMKTKGDSSIWQVHDSKTGTWSEQPAVKLQCVQRVTGKQIAR